MFLKRVIEQVVDHSVKILRVFIVFLSVVVHGDQATQLDWPTLLHIKVAN